MAILKQLPPVHLRLILPAIVCLSMSSHFAQAQTFTLIDDFEGYTVATYSGGSTAFVASGGPWQSNTAAATGLVAIQNDSITNHLAHGWATGTRGASRAVTPITNSSAGTYYFRIRTADTTPDVSFGLSDVTSGTTFAFGDFEVQVALITSGGAPAIGARNGSTFQTLATGLNANTWYDVWISVDNTTDTYDVFYGTSGNPAIVGTQIANDFAFRNGLAANDLTTFMTLSNNHADLQAHLDDIRYSSSTLPDTLDGITYVDATTSNTARWDGTTFTPAAQGNTIIDNNWETRSFGTNGEVFESNADGAEDAPLLVTTITGLDPDTEYVLYGYFWDASTGNWAIKASADSANIDDNDSPSDLSDDFLPSSPIYSFASDSNAGGTATDASPALGAAFATAPLLTEADRTLMVAPLGTATSDGSGNIAIFIDDLANVDQSRRTWFDGVGYKLATPLDPAEDEDQDGLTNGEEATAGTNPYIADTDGDTYSDGEEIAAGSDPLNAASFPPLPGNSIEIAPDGAWTWFNDERAIFHLGKLYAGYVLADGRYGVTRYDPQTNTSSHAIISTAASKERDDHNNPSITVLPDNKLLLVYSKHITNDNFYHRTSLVAEPASIEDWGPEIAFDTSIGVDGPNNTYANTYRLSGESDKIYNFHRNINFNPTITISSDNGATWGTPTHFINTGGGGTRPYPRYCSNHIDRIDLIYTDGHPRDVNNSVYHMYYNAGAFYQTDGTLIDTFANLPLDHDGGQKGSVVYQYSNAAWGAGEGPDDWIPGGRGWTWDIHYGTDGNPVCLFQVQVDNVTGTGWNHDRIYYYYARWTGTTWEKKFIAHGGRGIYSAEDDYGGGMALDPSNPNAVYFSSNAAAPFNLGDISNVPLSPNERYEIWRGVTKDEGQTFTWEQITVNSSADNLRPIVPENHGYDRTLIWFNGSYSSYLNFDCRVLALMENKLAIETSSFSLPSHSGSLTWSSSPGRSYRIGATTDLLGFPHDAAIGIPSAGGSTSHTFNIPAALIDSPKGFFRVEEE